jgi:hypothetical protein
MWLKGAEEAVDQTVVELVERNLQETRHTHTHTCWEAPYYFPHTPFIKRYFGYTTKKMRRTGHGASSVLRRRYVMFW